mmetsp:Transcript_47450/g.125311  ORF Transcript_47450/g.125311 Transcript_47450/m.125311 type:complete len:213 (-) Transcript_47450:104-742(-)
MGFWLTMDFRVFWDSWVCPMKKLHSVDVWPGAVLTVAPACNCQECHVTMCLSFQASTDRRRGKRHPLRQHADPRELSHSAYKLRQLRRLISGTTPAPCSRHPHGTTPRATPAIWHRPQTHPPSEAESYNHSRHESTPHPRFGLSYRGGPCCPGRPGRFAPPQALEPLEAPRSPSHPPPLRLAHRPYQQRGETAPERLAVVSLNPRYCTESPP